MKITNKNRWFLIIFSSWLLVLSIRIVPVGGVWLSLDVKTILVVTLWFIFYFIFVLAGISYGKHRNNFLLTQNTKSLVNWIKILNMLSILGAVLIIFDFSVNRGYGFTTPVSQIRILEVQASLDNTAVSSWTSGIGRMLTPALMVSWVIAVLIWSKLKVKVLAYLFFSSFVVFYQQFMFEGGRFFIASLLCMIWITAKAKAKAKAKIRSKALFLILGIVAIFFFGFIFVDRFSEKDFYTAYAAWTGAFNLTLSDALQSRLDGDLSAMWLSISMLWVYVSQGFNGLDTVVDVESLNHAWGMFQFPQLIQAANKISGNNFSYDVFENVPNPGTYITLYGASYIDFGHIGSIIFISIIGWVTGRSIKSFQGLKLDLFAINAPLLITLGIFSPIVSLVINLWPAFFWGVFVSFFISKSVNKYI